MQGTERQFQVMKTHIASGVDASLSQKRAKIDAKQLRRQEHRPLELLHLFQEKTSKSVLINENIFVLQVLSNEILLRKYKNLWKNTGTSVFIIFRPTRNTESIFLQYGCSHAGKGNECSQACIKGGSNYDFLYKDKCLVI